MLISCEFIATQYSNDLLTAIKGTELWRHMGVDHRISQKVRWRRPK